MPYRYYNPNPARRTVDDCVVRAISILFNMSWLEAYDDVYLMGREMYNMPSANEVWGEYLHERGFVRVALPDFCPNCYTISMFCKDHKKGRYAVATGSHVVAVIDGYYYDTNNSGDEAVAYYWKGMD